MASRDTFTAAVPQKVEEATEFLEWLDEVDGSLLTRIETTKELIENDGIITLVKNLDDGLYEKKWTSGLRLYFAVVEKDGRKTLLILGSGKGKDQDRAIKEAKKILKNYKVFKGSIRKKD